MDAGLLLARLVLGVLMAAHGSQKLFGWFGGYGLDGTAGFFEALGFRPGRLFAATAAATEIAGGLLLALGLLGPFGAALIVSVMIVAAVSVHWQHGVFAANNGIEVPLLYGAGAAALALTGPGAVLAGCAARIDAVLDARRGVERDRDRRDRWRRQSGDSPAGRASRSRVIGHGDPTGSRRRSVLWARCPRAASRTYRRSDLDASRLGGTQASRGRVPTRRLPRRRWRRWW